MKNKIVKVPSITDPIKPSPGFDKKGISDFKLDLMGLCGFGCAYCSSNEGNYLRIRRKPFLDLTEQQLSERVLPSEDPSLTFVWPDVLTNLKLQLDRKGDSWGEGHTLVFSMLTDAFSPVALKDGTTEAALRMLLERTRFRIRVLTKNAAVSSQAWIRLFMSHPDRFIVGLSIGTLDDEWARRIEVGTSSPTARLKALARLQDAGVPTFGMACPIFPDVLEAGALDELIDRVRPALVEDFWAEPYNDRTNWAVVRKGYAPSSAGYAWLTEVYEHRHLDRWSEYATDLYVHLRARARDGGWIQKLRYLLYEGDIVERDAARFAGLEGVMLQSKPSADGRSTNPFIAWMQQAMSTTSTDPSAADPRERSHVHLPLLSEQLLLPPAPDERADDERHQGEGSEGHPLAEAAGRSGTESDGDDLRGAIVGDAAIATIRRWKAKAPSPKNPGRRRRRLITRVRLGPPRSQVPNVARARLRKAMAKQQRKDGVPADASTAMKEKNKVMTTASLSNPMIAAQPMDVREIPLSEIAVPKRRARRLRDVEPFMESIDKRGLIEPIVVRLNPSGPGLLLISGEHRLEAHRRLGRETISARVVEVSDSEAELLEIDANLVHYPLTALERGELTTRRKELYEQIHPETKQGGAPGKSGGGKKAKNARAASFADDMADKFGRAKRTIQEANQIGRIAHDAREAIRGTWLENQKRVLLEISKVAEQDQVAVAQIMISAKCSRAETALLKLGVTEAPLPRRKRGGLAIRVGEVLKPLRETRTRWASLVAELGLANTNEAKVIGEDFEALQRKIEEFARSRDAHAEPARLALPPWNGDGDENDVAA